MSFKQTENQPETLKLRKKESLLKQIIRDKYLFLLFTPTLIYLIIFKYLPMFGIVIAFKRYNIYAGVWASDWVGLRYFELFFSNPDSIVIIKNTFLLGIYKLIWGFPAPIILALLLHEMRLVVFRRFVQTISYLPHFISTVVVAGMVTLFLSPTSGLVNDWLQALGFDPIAFLQRASWFRTIYVSSEVWQGVGWGSIIYLAAMTTVDPQLYEAAEIDGANRWKKIRNVTLPGIYPAIIILLILNVGNILETGFEKVFLLQNPATYSTSDIISTFVYRVGLIQGNYSYGAAADLFMGVISFVLVYMVNAFARRVGETTLW